jgi:photosystem II stability/assembly factor-like uncharacterized protein
MARKDLDEHRRQHSRACRKGNWISWVEASRFDPATAYVTVDRHTFGDMAPYVYRTRDYGKTWTPLIAPDTQGVRGYAHVVKEDPKSPNILYVGTEFGLYVSLDGGANWAPLRPTIFRMSRCAISHSRRATTTS